MNAAISAPTDHAPHRNSAPLLSFVVTITTESGQHQSYTHIARHAADVQIAAIDRFGLCKTIVRPQ